VQDRRRLFVGVFGPDRNDEPEPRPHAVEPDAFLLADLDPLLAFERLGNLGLYDFFDTLQMRRKPRPVAGRLARLSGRPRRQPRVDLLKAGLDFLEYEALLLGVVGSELFGTLAEAAPPQRLQDRGQPRDLGLGHRVGLRQIVDFGLSFRTSLRAACALASARAAMSIVIALSASTLSGSSPGRARSCF
jgi:hypothetical protein